MSWLPCCCGPCKCIGCVKITVSGFALAVTEGEPYDTAWTQAYNRTVTFWTKTTTVRTPFDLIHADGLVAGCIDDAEAYPGTECVMVADACCDPQSDDPLDPPDTVPPTPL